MTRGEKDASPLLIVRVAGLTADFTSSFGSTELDQHYDDLQAAIERADVLRSDVVDLLYEAISGNAPERRHFLLAIKRDCFNGRDLERHRGHEQWPEFEAAAGDKYHDLKQAVLAVSTHEEALEACLRTVASHEHEALVGLLDDRSFLRALALSSPTTAGKLDRLHDSSPGRYNRRQRNLVATVLRYATRAAVKLSPFSTFTHVGLGEVSSAPAPHEPVRLTPGPWDVRSVVRLRTFVLEQALELLKQHEPFLAGWRVERLLFLDQQLRHVSTLRSRHRPGPWPCRRS